MMKRIALPFLFALTLVAVPKIATAQRRSPLADAPAVRKRVELRETRFDVGVNFGSTINQTFYHGLMLQGHLGFHLTDWLSIAAFGALDVSPLATGFHDELIRSLGTNDMSVRTPSVAAVQQGINKPGTIFGGQAEVTAFAGKYSLFGKLFAHYDFYVFGGPAFVSLAAVNSGGTACADRATAMNGTCVATGGQLGGTFGGGIHSFFNNFVALNFEVRDVLIKDNPAGRDVNGDSFADKRDLTWTSHVMATLGVTLYLPAQAEISP